MDARTLSRPGVAEAMMVAAAAAVALPLGASSPMTALVQVGVAATCGAAAWRLWGASRAWVAALAAAVVPTAGLLDPWPLALMAAAPVVVALAGPRGAWLSSVALAATAPAIAAAGSWVGAVLVLGAAVVVPPAAALASRPPTGAGVRRIPMAWVGGTAAALLAVGAVAPRVDALAALDDAGIAVAGAALLVGLQGLAIAVAHRARDAARAAWPLASLAVAAAFAATVVVPSLPTRGLLALFLLMASVQAPVAAALGRWGLVAGLAAAAMTVPLGQL